MSHFYCSNKTKIPLIFESWTWPLKKQYHVYYILRTSLATGDGEEIMKFCPSFKIVQLMKDGRSPQEACEDVIRGMKEHNEHWFEVGVIALDIKVQIAIAFNIL